MPEIKTVRVVDLTELFGESELEELQSHITNMWTWGDTPKTLVALQDIIEVAEENEIEATCDLSTLGDDIMVDLEN